MLHGNQVKCVWFFCLQSPSELQNGEVIWKQEYKNINFSSALFKNNPLGLTSHDILVGSTKTSGVSKDSGIVSVIALSSIFKTHSKSHVSELRSAQNKIAFTD